MKAPLWFRLPLLAALALLSAANVSPVAAQGATCTNSGAGATTTWTPWECVLEVRDNGNLLAGRKAYLNRLKVEYSAVGAYTNTGYAAWDGTVVVNNEVRHRFVLRHYFEATSSSPTVFTWRTVCETATSCGTGTTTPSLVSSGQVSVTRYSGSNGLRRFGPLVQSGWSWHDNGVLREWETLRQWSGSGTFSWVGDSAWAAPMKASDTEWATYIGNRSARVSVIHIGPAPAWAGDTDKAGRAPFTRIAGCTTTQTVVPTPCDIPNPAFWQGFEGKIKVANDQGLYIFLAGMMEPRSKHDPPNGPHNYPTVAEAVNFAHWLSARLGGCFVVFSPGFDSPTITKDSQNLIVQVGKELKRVNPLHLVTNHWATIDLGEISALHLESWLDFEMFQSGHKDGNLSALTQRAREMAWKISGAGANPQVATESPFVQREMATINGEAIYDQGGKPTVDYSDYRARQAGYLSWLSGGAGYSFGVGGIWDWGVFGSSWAPGWQNYADAMIKPSANSMLVMKQQLASRSNDYLDAYEQNRILIQESDQSKKMVLVRSSYQMMAYLPHNQSVKIRYTTGNQYTTINPCTAKLIDPKSGGDEPVCPVGTTCTASGGCNASANPPDIICSNPVNDCTWRNRRFIQGDAPASDRVLQLTTTPPRMWEGEAGRRLEVTSGKLAGGSERLTENTPWAINGWLLDGQNNPMGAPFEIYAAPGVEGRSPAVAHDGKGDFLVVWQQLAAEGSTDLSVNGVFGRWVKASGQFEGAPFRISPASTEAVATPAVALDATGNAVVVWQAVEPVEGLGQIQARSVSRAGVLGAVSVVASGPDVHSSHPRAVMSRSGNLRIAWVEQDAKAETSTIRLKHYGQAGLRAAPFSEQVSSVPASDFWLINLHLDEADNLEIEYEARFGGRGGGTYLQAYDATGAKSGGETLLVPAFIAPE